MTRLSVQEAQARLPELLNEAVNGEEIVIEGDGATYKVTVVALEAEHVAAAPEDNPPLTALKGAGGGRSFSSVEEVDSYIRNLRDEWES